MLFTAVYHFLFINGVEKHSVKRKVLNLIVLVKPFLETMIRVKKFEAFKMVFSVSLKSIYKTNLI